jgi:hypothetical protein
MEQQGITVLQFELRLSDALRRAGATELPTFGWSMCLIPLEYEIMRALACTGCARTGLLRGMQSALPARDDQHRERWSGSGIAGDRLICRCPTCGQSMELYFWFVDGDLTGFGVVQP